MGNLSVFVPITKVDAAKQIVYGVLAEEVPDRSGEIFDYGGSKPYFEKWSNDCAKATDGKSVGNLRAMHGAVAAGKFTDMGFDDDHLRINVAAKVVDKNEWEKVLEGVYTGFSIGGKYVSRTRDDKNEKLYRYVADPYEGSLVDLPCIPTATFEIVKADGTVELKKFAAKEIPFTNDTVAAEAQRLAKAAGDESKWAEHITEACGIITKQLERASALKAAGDHSIAHVHDEPLGEENWAQDWVHSELPGKSFRKKSDLRAALLAARAASVAAKAAQPATDAMKLMREELERRTYSPAERKKYAGDGVAMKGGEYPIPDKASLKDVVEGLARARNQAATKRHIIRRAKSLGATAELPENWRVKAAEVIDVTKIAEVDVKKAASLYGVANLIQLLASLDSAEESLEGPGYGYGVVVSKELCDRFGALLVEMGDICAEVLDECLQSIREEEAAEANGAMERGMIVGDLAKVVGRMPLAKIGARHSKTDQRRLNDAHDLLVDAGADCEASQAEKIRGSMNAQLEAFQKTIRDQAAVITDWTERIKKMESIPLPEGTTRVNVVEKGMDGRGGDAGSNVPEPERRAQARVNADMHYLLTNQRRMAQETRPGSGTPRY